MSSAFPAKNGHGSDHFLLVFGPFSSVAILTLPPPLRSKDISLDASTRGFVRPLSGSSLLFILIVFLDWPRGENTLFPTPFSPPLLFWKPGRLPLAWSGLVTNPRRSPITATLFERTSSRPCKVFLPLAIAARSFSSCIYEGFFSPLDEAFQPFGLHLLSPLHYFLRVSQTPGTIATFPVAPPAFK